MAISKRAKVRMKAMTQGERKAVVGAAKKLYEAELMGPKRFMEIQRFARGVNVPLPDATDPADSNVYQQLSSNTLDDLDDTNYKIVRDPVFLSSENEDELRRLKLVGELTGHSSSSGPLADGGGPKSVSVDYDVTGPVILAPIGEVWRVQLLILRNATDVTLGSIPQLVQVSTPGDDSTVSAAEFLLDSATNISAGTDLRLTDNMLGLSQDLTITSTMGLRYIAVSGSPTSGTKQMRIFYLRER